MNPTSIPTLNARHALQAIDTGTTLIYLPSQVADSFYNMVRSDTTFILYPNVSQSVNRAL